MTVKPMRSLYAARYAAILEMIQPLCEEFVPDQLHFQNSETWEGGFRIDGTLPAWHPGAPGILASMYIDVESGYVSVRVPHINDINGRVEQTWSMPWQLTNGWAMQVVKDTEYLLAEEYMLAYDSTEKFPEWLR